MKECGLAKPTDSSGDSKSSQTDSSDDQADSLRRGWLTGYSYNACRTLYFERYSLDKGFKWETWDNLPTQDAKAQADEKKKITGLLVYLNTYKSLVDHWNIDAKHKKTVEKMIENTEEFWKAANRNTPQEAEKRKKAKHEPVALEDFDTLFHTIEGVAGAENQLGYLSMEFSGCANAMDNLEKAHIPEVEKEIKGRLLDLKNFLSESAYSVVENDIDEIVYDAKTEGLDDDLKRDQRRTWDWPNLILGTRSVTEILNDNGKGLLHFLIALFGALIFLIVFLVIGVIFNYIPDVLSYFKIDLTSISLSNINDLISSLATIIGILTGVGVSLAIVAQKTWNGLKTLETKFAELIARKCSFRTACQKTDDEKK